MAFPAEVLFMSRPRVRAWFSDEEGATASEYAVMLVLLICAVIASVTAVGNSTAAGWSNNVSQVQTACNGS
jgi:pilus assembly protein Flp/PilA